MRFLRPLIVLCFATVLLALPTTASAIVDGEIDTSHDYVVFVGQTVHWTHPSFPSISGPNTVPINQTACSGTLVSPTVVVTAAHCSLFSRPQIWPNQPWFPPGSPFPQDAVATRVTYVVRQGDDVIPPLEPGTSFVAVPATMHVQPGFTFGGNGLPGFSNNDLAVLTLSAPLAGPYATLPGAGAASAIHPTEELEVVGYGVSEMHGSTPIVASRDGQRRRAAARLLRNNAVADDLLHFIGGACLGDSGGPLLDGNVVLGVVSFTPSACKSTNYATRLDTADSLAFLAGFGVS
jgi:Trypsin